MQDARVLIVGTVRNCRKNLRSDVARLGAAFAGTAALQWLLVESDSDDQSVAILSALKNEVSGFDFISHGRLRERMAKRTERLAFCRNSYLQALKNLPDYAEITHVAVADFDGINTQITRASVERCWSHRIDWDMVAANQLGPYYDIWALRHPRWSPDDCWKQYAFLESIGLTKRECLWRTVSSRMVTLPPEQDWIEVDSAFGGLAIYRREVLEDVDYAGVDEDGTEFCEHVHLHAQLRAKGAKLFINPAMINAGVTEHTKHLFLYFRVTKALKELKIVRSVMKRVRRKTIKRAC